MHEETTKTANALKPRVENALAAFLELDDGLNGEGIFAGISLKAMLSAHGEIPGGQSDRPAILRFPYAHRALSSYPNLIIISSRAKRCVAVSLHILNRPKGEDKCLPNIAIFWL